MPCRIYRICRIMEEERNGASGRKQKYTHFTPEARVKIAEYAAQCGNAAAFYQEVSNSRREYSALKIQY